MQKLIRSWNIDTRIMIQLDKVKGVKCLTWKPLAITCFWQSFDRECILLWGSVYTRHNKTFSIPLLLICVFRSTLDDSNVNLGVSKLLLNVLWVRLYDSWVSKRHRHKHVMLYLKSMLFSILTCFTVIHDCSGQLYTYLLL